MIRSVQYARTLDGKLVAVEQGPHSGWAMGDAVFATKAEANAAAGRLNQQIYIEEQLDEISYGLGCFVSSHSPFTEWREKYGDRERERDLVEDILREMFPTYGKRTEAAQRFAEAFVLANTAYMELHA